jgi:acyl carrier protein
MADSIRSRVRGVIGAYAGLPVGLEELADDADLFLTGMSSHASVSVMVALENEFDIEFPDSMLERSVFESVDALTGAITELVPADPEPVRPAD